MSNLDSLQRKALEGILKVLQPLNALSRRLELEIIREDSPEDDE